MKDTDLAWAAGIIDGEGCLYISKSQALYLRVSMTDYPTVKRLHTMFAVGVFDLAIKRGVGNWRSTYSWICAAKDTRTVLLLVRPYLFTKLDQAEIALDYVFLPPMKKEDRTAARERMYIRMKICKEKEWDWSLSEE